MATNYTFLICIKGSKHRGNEVLEILNMMGGIDQNGNDYNNENLLFYLDNETNKIIHLSYWEIAEYMISYTVESFWEKYPFKIGDTVSYKGCSWVTKIIGIREIDGRIGYRLTGGGVDNYYSKAEDLVKIEDVTFFKYKEEIELLLKLSDELCDDGKAVENIKYVIGCLEFKARKLC